MNIKSSTTILQDYNGFSKYCHELDEPVILTHNDEADLVIMSYETYKRMGACNALQSELLVAERQISEGTSIMIHVDVIETMRRKINDKKEKNNC
ncbi:type II toxin-antitoxin system Phd/YefM family antitoxin [Robertmurraya kyonggiensis]|uniref:Type II toxin-antitoxin system Phd/YefM family antitoxin n=1 Tax=Robertmurraya kyonggiensis TaxID=1037680 RepID=A0A4U1D1L3_9BACI|nr:type II toxin-antitoxin system Phd/YefM family antitoxin [Robertmurraya kyonggiensis]TKC16142.1 type II toxin-antitoxin system Phd/YefM family antitoxin [Robertmurraya kyonggiensis]